MYICGEKSFYSTIKEISIIIANIDIFTVGIIDYSLNITQILKLIKGKVAYTVKNLVKKSI